MKCKSSLHADVEGIFVAVDAGYGTMGGRDL